ncbi:MAG: TrkA family potassium uptake protein [Clostridiales bacterium]|nr:TrkA family potassium uptake protein [Clostridiales bacterium]
MQVVVIGCGKIGIKFAKKMSGLNNDVTIIDSNKELTKKISKEFDGRVINGLEFDKTILENANVKEANCIVVSTDKDNTNIMVAQVLNKIFDVKNIIICLQNPSLAKIYEDSSFKIICPTNIVTDKIMEIMDK